MPLVPANSPAFQAPSPPQNQQQLVFDFTKRKQWADLLVSNLTEAIMLILSQTGQVWYCGPAIEELLGWKDEEVTDTNVCDIMNADDRATFQRQFQESIQNKSDLLAYARLQCKTAKDLYPNVPALQLAGLPQATEDAAAPPREILFEIKGYPHFVGSPENISGMSGFTTATEACVMAGQSQHRLSDERSGARGPFRCYFAMAKPYPSRNTAMLNTFLELKMENERLQSRLQAAKAQAESLNLSITLPVVQRSASGPSTSAAPLQSSYMPLRTYPYALHTMSQSGSNESTTSYCAYDLPSSNGPSAQPQSQEDDNEGNGDSGQPRKKPKRAGGSEMYVCTQCGRTDSPEWRKGPQGPKTLCNACGLRWAKSNRGTKDSSATTTTASNQPLFSIANPTTSSPVNTVSPSGSSTGASPITSATAESSIMAGQGATSYMGTSYDQTHYAC